MLFIFVDVSKHNSLPSSKDHKISKKEKANKNIKIQNSPSIAVKIPDKTELWSKLILYTYSAYMAENEAVQGGERAEKMPIQQSKQRDIKFDRS